MTMSRRQQEQVVAVSTTTGSVKETMLRSTIYDRHEERRLRSLLNKDDTRPAVIRVLSGLPGFRMFIPPYDPSTISLMDAQKPTSNVTQFCPNFADPTVFTNGSILSMEDTTVGSTSSLTTSQAMSLSSTVAVGGLVAIAAWNLRRPSLARGVASSVFIASRKSIPQVNPAAIYFSSSAVGPASMEAAIPMFTSSNTAVLAFLRPVPFQPVPPRRAVSVPAARNIFAISFLAFVAYKNAVYYEEKRTTCCSADDEDEE